MSTLYQIELLKVISLFFHPVPHQGTYGRLGLGHNDLQTSLQVVDTFPAGAEVRSISSSKGSDGHSLAVTAQGKVYSWGDGAFEMLSLLLCSCA